MWWFLLCIIPLCVSIPRETTGKKCGDYPFIRVKNVTTDRFECMCSPGWIKDDRGSCVDINECENKNVGCKGKCVNQPGSWECIECPRGTVFNKISCVAPLDIPPQLPPERVCRIKNTIIRLIYFKDYFQVPEKISVKLQQKNNTVSYLGLSSCGVAFNLTNLTNPVLFDLDGKSHGLKCFNYTILYWYPSIIEYMNVTISLFSPESKDNTIKYPMTTPGFNFSLRLYDLHCSNIFVEQTSLCFRTSGQKCDKDFLCTNNYRGQYECKQCPTGFSLVDNTCATRPYTINTPITATTITSKPTTTTNEKSTQLPLLKNVGPNEPVYVGTTLYLGVTIVGVIVVMIVMGFVCTVCNRKTLNKGQG